jgi:hypothetical protein
MKMPVMTKNLAGSFQSLKLPCFCKERRREFPELNTSRPPAKKMMAHLLLYLRQPLLLGHDTGIGGFFFELGDDEVWVCPSHYRHRGTAFERRTTVLLLGNCKSTPR